MHLEPAVLDSPANTGAEFRAASLQLEDEGVIDFLDMDAPVLDRLDAGGELEELSCSGFWRRVRADFGVFHEAV